MKTLWILTRWHSGYDQHGSYFIGGWSEKPTIDQRRVCIQSDGCSSITENELNNLISNESISPVRKPDDMYYFHGESIVYDLSEMEEGKH